MDDATVVKSCLCQRSLHGLVIPVGVNADVTGLCEAIIKDAGHDPVLSMRTCHAMKNIIRSVSVNPMSIVNDCVGDNGSGNEGKGGYGSAVPLSASSCNHQPCLPLSALPSDGSLPTDGYCHSLA